jgi:hypothetical protein
VIHKIVEAAMLPDPAAVDTAVSRAVDELMALLSGATGNCDIGATEGETDVR